jgi:hypothetical protein
MVVELTPSLDDASSITQVSEPFTVQAFVAPSVYERMLLECQRAAQWRLRCDQLVALRDRAAASRKETHDTDLIDT